MATHKEKPLSQIILRLLLAIFTVTLLPLMVLNYQSGYQAVQHEAQQHIKEVSTLLHTVLNYQLSALSHSQDYNAAAAPEILRYLDNQNTVSLDNYFSAVDENADNSTPDFRFIAIDHKVVWNDSNSYYLGFWKEELSRLLTKPLPNHDWQLRTAATPLGDNQILLRKTPIIAASGKVAASLYIAIVLNDNTSLMQQFQEIFDCQVTVLVHQGQIIASSLRPDSPDYLTLSDYLNHSNPRVADNLFIKETPIRLKDKITDISVVALHNHSTISDLKSQFIRSALVGIALIILLSILAIHYFRKYTFTPLNKLVKYARHAATQHRVSPYPHGAISEYNRIGKAFEETLSQLSEKDRSLHDLFSSAFSPILVWDCNLTLMHINPAAKKCLGLALKTPHGQESFAQFERDAKPYLQQALGGNIVKEIVLNTMEERAFLWNLAPVTVNGKTNAIIAQGLDITMIKQAEEDSHQARQAAEEANRAKSAFLATISHEIRTPLNGILGMAQIIQDTLTEREQQQQMKVLYDSANHLLTLLSDILDFSKIEQGRLELNKVDFQLGDMLDSISEIYLPLCAQKGLELEVCNMLDTQLRLYADDAKIRQILFNLLSNAVKFTHSGKVSLSIKHLAEDDSKIFLQWAVSDTGIGIRKERIDKLFQPFVQAESSITRQYGGTGLGLSIVKKLVEQMNGEISVDSQLGSGTTITVLLPLDKSQPEMQSASHEKPETASLEKLDILLVEDNKINALVAKTFCEKQGCHVHWVQNGQLAVEAVKNQDFDLIIMDNHMPVMDGIETTKRIRHELQRNTVIFAYTADVFSQTRNALIAAGANEVLVKPLDKTSFLHALQQNRQQLQQRQQQKNHTELDSPC